MAKEKSTEIKFANLDRLKVQKKTTASLSLYTIEGTPILTGVYAGQSNGAFQSALLKANREQGRKMAASVDDGDALVDMTQDLIADLFGEHIITGWNEAVVDVDGNPVPFSSENAKQYLRALPVEELEQVTAFFQSRKNFIPKIIDHGKAGKN